MRIRPATIADIERCERLDWEPGHFLRRVTIRTRYGRKDTRESVITAPVPPAIVARGLGGDRLVLHIAHQKYGLGLPLYRQRSEWLRHGIDLSTQTACSWMRHLGTRLRGVAGAIRLRPALPDGINSVVTKGETMLSPGILRNSIFLLWLAAAAAIAQTQASRTASAASSKIVNRPPNVFCRFSVVNTSSTGPASTNRILISTT